MVCLRTLTEKVDLPVIMLFSFVKALLIHDGATFPKTHDLVHLSQR